MVSEPRVPYGRPMSDTATPTQEQPLPRGSDDLPPAASTPRIIGGVAASLADGLAVDALWIRIGFVLLALVGGLGLVVYGALWLVLVAGPSSGSRVPIVVGAAILVAGLPVLLGGFSLDSPTVLFVLLAGLAVALWQPRWAGDAPTSVARPSSGGPAVGPAEAVRERIRAPRPRRDPSPLGAIALGAAMVVASALALIDEANGGRLHPEVWHGAAAAVCGIGLLVGTVRGHARWLIVPAIVLAGMGVLSGEMARLEIGAADVTGDRWVWVDGSTSGPISERSGLGTVHVEITEVPATHVEVDARVAVGTISVSTSDDVAVDVIRIGDPPERIGRADGPADVTVDARVGIGRVDLDQWTRLDEAFADGFAEPITGRPGGLGDLTPVADLVAMTDDGWFVLAQGEVVIDDQNRVAYGDEQRDGDGVTRLDTSYGLFTVLPRGLLLTPDDRVLDLEALRSRDPEPPVEPSESSLDPSLATVPVDPRGDLP